MTGIIKPTKAEMLVFAGDTGPEDGDCDGSAGCYGRSLGVIKHLHEDHRVPVEELARKITTRCRHAREALIDYTAAFLPVGHA